MLKNKYRNWALILLVTVAALGLGFSAIGPSSTAKAIVLNTNLSSQLLSANYETLDAAAPVASIVDTVDVVAFGSFVGMTVDLQVSGVRLSDLYIWLEHVPSGRSMRLLNHVGVLGLAESGCSSNNLHVTLGPAAAANLDQVTCADASISGDFLPYGSFDVFKGLEDVSGEWALHLVDYGATEGDLSPLSSLRWSLHLAYQVDVNPAQTADPNPTATPIPQSTAPSGDNGSSTDGSRSDQISLNRALNFGLVMISTAQAQPVYAAPGGDIVIVNGGELWLPQDADANGFDTYVVNGLALIDGEIWVALFLGGSNPGWVPLDLVTPLTYLGEEHLGAEGSGGMLVPINSRVWPGFIAEPN